MGQMSVSATFLSPDQWQAMDARIKRVDEDRWLSSRYAPESERRRLIALYAFVYELARVRNVVSEPGLGAIRFQWWREALEEIGEGKVRQHDVVLAIAAQVAEKNLTVSALGLLIDRHEAAFLSHDRSQEPEDMLITLAVQCLGVGATVDGALTDVAMEWAALRRSDPHSESAPWQMVASSARPAVAHLRLRHLWQQNPNPSALKLRLSILTAMLTGRV